MKLSKEMKEALKRTKELYIWHRDNPKRLSMEWPGWKKYGVKFDDSGTFRVSKDFLCEASGKCIDCPLLFFWVEDSRKLTRAQRLKSCLVQTSPMMEWINNRDKPKGDEALNDILDEIDYVLKNGPRAIPEGFFEPNRRQRRERPARPRRARREETTGRVRRER